MARLIVLVTVFLIAACANPDRPATDRAGIPSVEVNVTRDGSSWTADYRFARASRIWVFRRSSLERETQLPWRPRAWRVETPGVRLARFGRYDVLIADTGFVPARVRIRFTPFAEDLLADYDPALIFTDGSVAIFDQHFEVFPVASSEVAARLPLDLSDHPETESTTRLNFTDRAGPVLHSGRRHESLTLESSGSYVLFGPAEPIVTDAMATVIDPQLPAWLRSALTVDTPAILADYARRLGPPPGSKPTFLISWAGPTEGVQSMGGSVLPALVVMRFEGEGVVRENEALRNSARWFIAHEGAHFWLGQAVRYQYSRDAWITEGGADLLAMRMVAATDPGYDARAALQTSLDDCIRFANGRSIEGAEERNEHQAYYACGAMFGLVAEAVSRRSGGDFFTFIRGLILANREDGVLTREEWLAELGRLSGDRALERDIRTMVETGVADPAATLESLFRQAGIPYRRDAQEDLQLL